MLEAFAAKGIPQHFSRKLRLRRVHKDQSAKRKQMGFDFATRSGPFDRLLHGRQATVNRFEVPPPRRRCFQKLDHLLNGLRLSRGVACCVSIANKKSAMTHNAVANRTETREEDKKP